MDVVKPIFIVGTGRCGSTAFHRLLSPHPNLMWLSGFAEQFPTRPSWNRWAVTAMGNPLLRRVFGSRIKPGENYGFWYKHAYGFAEPGRDLLRADVTPRVRKQIRGVIARMLTAQRSRMLVKLTGWSRIGYLNEIFEDAKFIHIVRDGRAVANSYVHINEWQWRGGTGRTVGDTARCRSRIKPRGKPAIARSWCSRAFSGRSIRGQSRRRGDPWIRNASSRSGTKPSASSPSRPAGASSSSGSFRIRRRSSATSGGRRSGIPIAGART